MTAPMAGYPSPTADPAVLFDRLTEMRAGLVEAMLRDGYSAGAGALLAGIAAALAALDAALGSPQARVPAASPTATTPQAVPPIPGPPARAVLNDEGGPGFSLAVFDGPDRLATVPLDAAGAVGLAAELAAAAHRRLLPCIPISAPTGDETRT